MSIPTYDNVLQTVDGVELAEKRHHFFSFINAPPLINTSFFVTKLTLEKWQNIKVTYAPDSKFNGLPH